MSGKLKAIETSYKGYLFRSRVEARWAVFLDALELSWEYEVEGYDLDGLWYLPDFRLPSLKCWLEIKGKGTDTRDDWEKCRRLALASAWPVIMLFGDFCPLHFAHERAVYDENLGFNVPEFGELLGSNRAWWICDPWEDADGVSFDDGCVEWGECPVCGLIAPGSHGQHKLCSCKCVNPSVVWEDQSRCAECGIGVYREKDFVSHQTWKRKDLLRLTNAYTAARSARFERSRKGYQ